MLLGGIVGVGADLDAGVIGLGVRLVSAVVVNGGTVGRS